MDRILLEGESVHFFAGNVFVSLSNRFSSVIDQEKTYHFKFHFKIHLHLSLAPITCTYHLHLSLAPITSRFTCIRRFMKLLYYYCMIVCIDFSRSILVYISFISRSSNNEKFWIISTSYYRNITPYNTKF